MRCVKIIKPLVKDPEMDNEGGYGQASDGRIAFALGGISFFYSGSMSGISNADCTDYCGKNGKIYEGGISAHIRFNGKYVRFIIDEKGNQVVKK